MNLKDRINAMVALGTHLLTSEDAFLDAIYHRTEFNNAWFTKDNQRAATLAVATQFLDREKLTNWANAYPLSDKPTGNTIGLVLAGNIPLVGFHDVLSAFIAGHKAQVKLSDKDRFLLPYLFQLLKRFDARTESFFEIVERLNGFDAVIATGSNNTARYFEAYFGKYPNIIRRNRHAVGVLTGKESDEDLLEIGKDIFKYFGLGCRNVSKVYVPKGYDLEHFLSVLHEPFKQVVMHSKYKNNFDYNYALYILNKVPIRNNGSLILTEHPSIQSRIASLHYEYYPDLETVEQKLINHKEEIQVVVSQHPFGSIRTVPLGAAQQPSLTDYADGVDTMAFLAGLGE